MTAGDYMIIAVAAGWFLLSVCRMGKRRKSGKCAGCCGCCGKCFEKKEKNV